MNNSQPTILFLGHGSRAPGAMEGMQQVAETLQQKYAVRDLVMCTMEGLGLNLRDAIRKCYAQGCRHMLVVPFFLHSGNHLLLDVPEMLNEARTEFPDLAIHQGRHLGADPALAELAFRRIQESLLDLEASPQ
ncbi:MAG TPA: CbiX/SirB N-terminal domain-containing protein [Fibrobacteraceae bacterium]|nr:CbiX/SirB N-terminal domain-containing protein [Fibrobacteraceae bacterium]